MLRKFLIGGTIVGILVLGAALVVRYSMGDFLKTVFESAGPKYTKGRVTVDSTSLTVLGDGEVKGIYLGNPMNEEFDSPYAMKLPYTTFKMAPGSPVSSAIVVDEIILDGAELCFDGVAGMNHRKIIENIEQFIDDDDSSASRRIVIKQFRMINTKVHLYVLGEMVTMSVPDLQLSNVGHGIGGIELREAVISIYRSLLESTSRVVKKEAVETGVISPIKEGAHQIKEKANQLKERVRGVFQ